MDLSLDEPEIRVLGCLMEKAMATPDYYPLSLNALTNACNQKSNRDPVVNWDEDIVSEAAESLMEKGLVNRSTMGRVPKYEETFTRQRNMVTAEAAVFCVLLLRGPQTPGAIRSRTERLYAFDDLQSVQETLERLDEWDLAVQLERLPGHKESRYMHRLGIKEASDLAEPQIAESPTPAVDPEVDMDRLEDRIDTLQAELADLRTAFEAFSRQFE